MDSWFTELSAIDVSEHTREKNGLTYLSWMWAWAELKKRYPLSYSTVHETPEGMIVWRDPIGGHVKTSITIVWKDGDEVKEHTVTEYLPCMDFKNKAVPYDNIDCMLVNKTVQRSLTKCIARLGLGGYIYANEDLPEAVNELNELNQLNFELASKIAKKSEAAKKQVGDTVRKFIPSGNPKGIKSIDVAQQLNAELIKISK